MNTIFITATNTNVGKTYTTLKLLSYLSRLGYKVGVFKPIETGVGEYPEDATKLLQACQKVNPDFAHLSTNDICPLQYTQPAAPYVAANLQEIDISLIFKTAQILKQYCDVLLIEGAGGLYVPIQKEYFMIDLMQDLRASVLLVTHDKLGCINDTLVNLHTLQSLQIQPVWCVNVKEPKNFEKLSRPFYQSYFKDVYTLQEHLPQITQALITDSHRNRNF